MAHSKAWQKWLALVGVWYVFFRFIPDLLLFSDLCPGFGNIEKAKAVSSSKLRHWKTIVTDSQLLRTLL